MGSCSRATFPTQLSAHWTMACSWLQALAMATLPPHAKLEVMLEGHGSGGHGSMLARHLWLVRAVMWCVPMGADKGNPGVLAEWNKSLTALHNTDFFIKVHHSHHTPLLHHADCARYQHPLFLYCHHPPHMWPQAPPQLRPRVRPMVH